jgi:hypothetical protein
MKIDDIIIIKVTDDMIVKAKTEAEWLNSSKAGEKTIQLYDDHNIIGSLGHQAVEIIFDRSKLPYMSYREEKYQNTGDTIDIKYENDLIDVKSHKGKFDEKWFYNQSFLVMTHQMEKLEKEISHLCFVLVDMDDLNCYLYGVISFKDFKEKATEKKLKYDNWEIKAKDLRPFNDYIFRV